MLHGLPETDRNAEFLREIHKASYRARDLVQQILLFSRSHVPENQAVHVIPIVKEVVKLQEASLPAGITVKRTIRTEHDLVMTTPTQMHQIMMNLCVNAIYAMRENGGELDIILSDVLVGSRNQTEFADLEPGHYLRITVRDTGTGMDKDTRERLFEPFFTTKPQGEGTGMGLAVVHGIITGLGGGIRVESAPGDGTTFHIVLPLEAVGGDAEVGGGELPTGGSARVLLIEDEVPVARMTANMMRSLDYEPTVALSGQEGVELVLQDPDAFDAVVTDRAMPGMSGDDVARRIQVIRSDLPVLLCTGYQPSEPEDDEASPFAGVVTKPIIMRQLAEALATALGKRGSG